jgi:hypothetical protein
MLAISNQSEKGEISAVSNQFGKSAISALSEQFEMSSTVEFATTEHFNCSVGISFKPVLGE